MFRNIFTKIVEFCGGQEEAQARGREGVLLAAVTIQASEITCQWCVRKKMQVNNNNKISQKTEMLESKLGKNL